MSALLKISGLWALDTSSSPEHLLQQADLAAILFPRGNGRGRWRGTGQSLSGILFADDKVLYGDVMVVHPWSTQVIPHSLQFWPFFFSFFLLFPPVVRQRVTSTSSGCWGQMARSGSGSWEKVPATSRMKRSLRSWLQRERGCRRSGKPRNSGERCHRVLRWGEGAGAWTRRLGVGSN